MPTIETSIDIKVPVNIAYNQWTQFETFPYFMQSVINVKQLDDRHVWWLAQADGHAVEWEAEIVEQVLDDYIAWRSVSGVHNEGVVSFLQVEPHSTRVRLQIEYECEDRGDEVASDITGILERKIAEDLERYRQILESRKLSGDSLHRQMTERVGLSSRY
ncbi:SRPBCC family protein [Methylobacillus methanolivorans]